MTAPHIARLAIGSLGVAVLVLTGCQGNTSSAPEQSTPASPEHSPESEPAKESGESPEPDSTEAAPSYTDPSTARTYCGALKGLVKMSEEIKDESEEAIVKGMDSRLELLAKSTARIGELAPDNKASQSWNKVSKDFGEASEFFKSSGRQIANTDFLVLLADATRSADATFRSQADPVRKECGVDISKLASEQK